MWRSSETATTLRIFFQYRHLQTLGFILVALMVMASLVAGQKGYDDTLLTTSLAIATADPVTCAIDNHSAEWREQRRCLATDNVVQATISPLHLCGHDR